MEPQLSIRDNLFRVLEAIAGARDSAGLPAGGDAVAVMAVTKNHPPAVVESVIAAGIRLIGENRVSEGGRKVAAAGRDRAEFHLIGPLHRSEVRQAIRDFRWIDSIDDVAVAAEIARRTCMLDACKAPPGILLEVNTSGEASKRGFAPDAGALERVLESFVGMGLPPAGLLTVGPLSLEEESSRRAFSRLRLLREDLSRRTGLALGELSMGMSDDFVWAVMEGATTVRLGRCLLGERQGR